MLEDRRRKKMQTWREMVKTLKPLERARIVLEMYVDGKQYDEIAQIFKANTSTIK